MSGATVLSREMAETRCLGHHPTLRRMRCKPCCSAVQRRLWEQQNDARVKKETGGSTPIVPASKTCPWVVSKIVYCSRTHSQLQQVAKELGKTAYSKTRCVHVIISSHGMHVESFRDLALQTG